MRHALVMAIAMVSLVACGPKAAGTATTDYRAFTEHYAFNITSDPSPPHAREKTIFKIRVRDKNSSQPIEGGEGIIYGNTEDGGGKTWDSFTPGQAPGTYTANLKFVVANELGARAAIPQRLHAEAREGRHLVSASSPRTSGHALT